MALAWLNAEQLLLVLGQQPDIAKMAGRWVLASSENNIDDQKMVGFNILPPAGHAKMAGR